jgi:hypothetical protein
LLGNNSHELWRSEGREKGVIQKIPVPPICEVVILTALGLEYKAVSEHLQDIQEITYQHLYQSKSHLACGCS